MSENDFEHYYNTCIKLKAEVEALYRERIGEVWYWQGDGEDHLESTTCPILIDAADLRELLKHKLPTPDSKEYQELQRVVCKQLNCYDKDCEYHGFPRCPYCVEIIDKVLALLGGKE